MVKILHGADFHLDTRFESLPPEKARELRRDQRRLMMSMAELVKKEGIQLVLLSGDLFDSGLTYYETQEALWESLEAMGVPVFIAPGNHDWYSSRSPYAAGGFPDNVRIFTSPVPTHVDLPQLGVRVWGAGFTSPQMPPILDGFRVPDSDLINIMTLHGELGGDSYGPIDEARIGDTKLDYLALGHVHSFSGIKRSGGTYYAYPGCPLGRGFDETGSKGVIIGTVDKGAVELRFTPLPGREYRVIRASQKKLDSSIPGDSRNLICRLVLTGQWDRKPDLRRIYEQYGDEFFHLTLRDETVPARDIWSGMEEDNLRGLFLRLMRERYDSDGSDREEIELAVEYGLAAFDNREEAEP